MKILREPLLLLLLTAVLAWSIEQAFGPPAVVGAEAPAGVFSAERALALLQDLNRENLPHPAASQQNALIRDRIVAFLRKAGFEPQVQRLQHCNPMFGVCSPVENIVAVLENPASEHAILVTAHYDSSWAGPGFADDGAGLAAVLEIARMARTRREPGWNHDVLFLLSDAEEPGLIGADAFARHHPLFASVRFVINLEARGADGGSAMFETGSGNRSIIRMLAQSLERPLANSLTYEVYKRMPNDTDLSVYRAHGATGINFAFTRGVAAYHSAVDDAQRLAPGSVQHHGQNAWAMLQTLDQRRFEKLLYREDAAYTDLFGRKLLHYPVSSAAGLSLVLSVVALLLVRSAFARQFSLRQVCWALAGSVALAVALPAAGWLLSWPLGGWLDQHPLEHPYPWPGRVALLSAGALLVLLVARGISHRSSTGSVMLVCWALYSALALGLSNGIPAASYVAVLPLLGFTIGAAADSVLRRRRQPRLLLASLGGYLGAAYVGLYAFFMLEVVMNFDRSMLRMMPLLLPGLAVLPLLVWYFDERRGGRAAMAVLAVPVLVVCGVQWLIPAYTPDRPRPMNLVHRQDAQSGQAWLAIEAPADAEDARYARQHGFGAVELVTLEGEPRSVPALSVEPLGLPAVTLAAASRRPAPAAGGQGGSLQVVELRLPQGLRDLVISLPQEPRFTRVRVGGKPAIEPEVAAGKPLREPPRRLTLRAPQAGLLRLELEPGTEAAFDLRVRARYPMPDEVLQPYLSGWPEDAQPAFEGHRVERDFVFRIGD